MRLRPAATASQKLRYGAESLDWRAYRGVLVQAARLAGVIEARSIRPPDWPGRARTRKVSACGPAAMAPA